MEISGLEQRGMSAALFRGIIRGLLAKAQNRKMSTPPPDRDARNRVIRLIPRLLRPGTGALRAWGNTLSGCAPSRPSSRPGPAK